MGRLKAGSPFIFDDDVDRPIGFRAPDGTETYFAPLARGRKKNTIALFGSSTMSRNFDANGYVAKGNFVQGNIRAGWPLTIVANFGRGGEDLQDMLARAGQVKSSGASYVGCELMFNDINDGRALQDIKRDTLALLNRFEDDGVEPIIFSTHPSDWLLDDPAKLSKWCELIEWLRQVCLDRGWDYYDQTPYIVDHATGGVKAGLTTDNHHLNGAGGALCGIPIGEGLARKFPSTRAALNQIDLGNYFPNPTMQDTIAVTAGETGVTGFKPTSLTLSKSNTSSAVASVADRADGQGKVFKFSGVNSAANGLVKAVNTLTFGTNWAASTAYSKNSYRLPTVRNGFMYKVVTAGTSGSTQPTWPTEIGATVVDGGVTWRCYKHLQASANGVAGTKLYAECELVETALTAGAAVPYLVVECQNSSAVVILRSYCNFLNQNESGEAYPTVCPTKGILRTEEFVIPEGCDRIITSITMQGGNGAEYTLGVGYLGLREPVTL